MSKCGHFLLVFYGDGKGKTTSALGLTLRVVGHGKRVLFMHFIKKDLGVGEYLMLKKLENVKYVVLGPGLGASRDVIIEYALKGLELSIKLASEFRPFLTVLDELGVVVVKHGLDIKIVIEYVDKLLEYSHVLVTGKYMPKELIERADLVTEFKCIRHYFRSKVNEPVEGLDF